MEERTIAIANTKTQRRYQINTSATTLGELQDEMLAQGIDFTGMTFTEGISKTQLLSRDSLLPTNVMYKGQPTNNLVMLLTNTTKQISSGCCDEPEERTRKNAYSIIKEMGKEAQDEIKEQYGRNYTQVSTDALWEYIDDNTDDYDDPEEQEEENEEEEEYTPTPSMASHPDLVEMIYLGIKYLSKTGYLTARDVAVIADLTTELNVRMNESHTGLSDNDIDDIIASM